jgi:hypothetical protein
VFGVIRGMTELDEEEIEGELEEIVAAFGGQVVETGYSSPNRYCSYDPRCARQWLRLVV